MAYNSSMANTLSGTIKDTAVNIATSLLDADGNAVTLTTDKNYTLQNELGGSILSLFEGGSSAPLSNVVWTQVQPGRFVSVAYNGTDPIWAISGYRGARISVTEST